MSQPLDEAIFRTIAWFSLFEMPLTVFEVWKWLLQPDRPYTLVEVDAAIFERPFLATRLQHELGFVALADSVSIETLVVKRQERFLDAARKFKKLKAAARWFRWIPSVRAVAACNTLAWHQTTLESDIDLFILVEPGKIWQTRLFLVAPFAFLRRRPKEAARDPFCFSFFLTANALCLESLALSPEDPYLAMWSRSVVPIFDRDGLFSMFHEHNPWVAAYLPHAHAHPSHEELSARSALAAFSALSALPLESISRRLQLARFPLNIRELANKDSRVVISDRMLKFHENDRRAEYRERWKELSKI